MSEVLPPALSSTQDADIEFAKTKDISKDIPRGRLGPINSQKARESADQLYSLLKEYYSVDKTAQYLNQKTNSGDYKFKEVALQFPDDRSCARFSDSMPTSSRVNIWRQESLGVGRYILFSMLYR